MMTLDKSPAVVAVWRAMSLAPDPVVVDAPAKVNLTLEILDRRPDGYHNLRSILVPIALFDRLTVTPRPGSGTTCSTRSEGVDASEIGRLEPQQHLAVRAVDALRAAAGRDDGVHIDLIKRIPLGAGLGGGSADAAGVLVALDRLWGLDWPRGRLAQVGAQVGCDVPALVLGGAVAMEGVGERVTRLIPEGAAPVPGFWLVLAYPGAGVSTCAVYQALAERRSAGDWNSRLTDAPETFHSMRSFVRKGLVHGACRWLFNGLQKTVFDLHPETERFCTALRDAGALSSLLSGSGSAVFGLAESQEHAERIQARLGADVWSRVLQTLPDGVMAAHGPLVP